MDETRVDIAGHSAGSHAAALAANGDRALRFAAAVAWDDFSGWPAETNAWPPEPSERWSSHRERR